MARLVRLTVAALALSLLTVSCVTGERAQGTHNTASRQGHPAGSTTASESTQPRRSTKVQAATSVGGPVGSRSAGGAAGAPNGVSPMSQELTRDEALHWWTPRPLLIGSELPDGGGTARYFARAEGDYRDADPTTEAASLSQVLVKDRREAIDGWGWLEGGGVALIATSYPSSVPEGLRPSLTPNARAQPIEIRGRKGTVASFEYAKGEHLTMLQWGEEVKDTTYVAWQIVAATEIYSRDQIVAWANALNSEDS